MAARAVGPRAWRPAAGSSATQQGPRAPPPPPPPAGAGAGVQRGGRSAGPDVARGGRNKGPAPPRSAAAPSRRAAPPPAAPGRRAPPAGVGKGARRPRDAPRPWALSARHPLPRASTPLALNTWAASGLLGPRGARRRRGRPRPRARARARAHSPPLSVPDAAPSSHPPARGGRRVPSRPSLPLPLLGGLSRDAGEPERERGGGVYSGLAPGPKPRSGAGVETGPGAEKSGSPARTGGGGV